MDDRYAFREIEARWQTYWEENRTFATPDDSDKPKFYTLEMFPYPSGAGLSVGHGKNYLPNDAFCRYKAMQGFNVLHPMGWDAFGQPAENEAIKRGRNPREMVPEYAANYRRTLKRLGASYDWSREVNSSTPDYYRWTQWFFLLLYKRGLAYRSTAPINWCPSCKTGLANEEVKEGRCWRCDSAVEKRPLPQWYFNILQYADRLLADLDLVNWPEGTKQMQREWIGRSEGAEVNFAVNGSTESIRVFTTRPDTLWGATFLVLAPEHPLVAEVTTPEQAEAVEAYVQRAAATADMDRLNAERSKSGVPTGATALNPVTGQDIPIWIADYVLMGYGTGAIMAVPAHDQRDFEFARKFDLPIELVYSTPEGPQTGGEMTEAAPHDGVMREFTPSPMSQAPKSPFAGRPNSKETVRDVVRWMAEQGIVEQKVNFKLRDWLISRQRYWGAPIPMVHCPECGEVPVPEGQLPVLLPEVDRYEPSGTGESPLATIEEFVNTSCPKCGSDARRETDTMGGFACSSWYFLRFVDPHNSTEFASREKLDKWLPVDLYTGGAEHAVMHLLYARFWTKVMYDAGLLGFVEPFTQLRHQGSLLAYTPGRKPRGSEADGDTVLDWIVLKPEERAGFPKDQIAWRWTRMSKSKGNVVSPDEMCEQFGADSLRLYEMFVAPFEDNVQWSEDGIHGAHRFINRAWRWIVRALPQYSAKWRSSSASYNDADKKIRRKLHQTIIKVGEDLEGFRFNTAISALMELVNDLYLYRPLDGGGAQTPAVLSEAAETLTLLLAPFTPHMADELWSRMGHKGTTYTAAWPVGDTQVAAEDEVTLVVQVNGKVRDRITVASDASEEAIKQLALDCEKVREALEGKTVRQVIVVPKRLVNVVAA